MRPLPPCLPSEAKTRRPVAWPCPCDRAMSRIGVLTFHRCVNYGSYWQARCLVEGIGAQGRDAVLLDHDSVAVNRAEWRCALQPRLPEPNCKGDLEAYATKTRRFFEAFAALPLSPRFDLDRPEQMAACDTVIVGSDEVWNLQHPWYGGCRLFWGEGVRAKRLVSYAASFGNHDAASGLPPAWPDRLRRFDRVSVRDANSLELVRDAGIDADLVLDPCLQFSDLINDAAPASRVPDYLLVYGHGFPDWFGKATRAAAARQGLSIVSVGYRNAFADKHEIEAGPDRFATLMAGAAAVVTNFFHGAVFAIVNRKPFATIASTYRANKLGDLTALLGLEERLLAGEDAARLLGDLIETPLPPNLDDRISLLRGRSSRYLASALG
ncbi:polysaccharide pyruvyl transferase family protein [Mesorhizobium sp. BR1-1-16]|uniref:polysaccharide pyruvyl transferase family protein n=1 Tax=Mesorhizobium sp. BR1-1-16 TaxID=2876653 RepID=UPI001CCA89CD|nr:polysaccharide pyruvyl transferase family protein [Mesorhizobium sp. BR1-1-16]MBZ9936954.1 polysaccharide pyruvyl transferase family protein [Mesorhizobium sp. BR1-1-16]